MMRQVCLAGLAMAALACGARAQQPPDLREFRIGESVQALPRSGYTGFACAAAPDAALQGWQDFARCPADAQHRHAVRFRYDPSANPRAGINDAYAGTRVGGHPVLLSLLIGDDATLDGIVVETDPAARLYLRKKAFLMAGQAKARYGEAGWRCTEAAPAGGEAPVGGVFIHEHCEKSTAARRYVLDAALYRRAGEDAKDFVSSTRLEILPAR